MKIEQPYRGSDNPDARKPQMPVTRMKLVPCPAYRTGKKSRRVRRHKWVPA